jgi:hypothetical protein
MHCERFRHLPAEQPFSEFRQLKSSAITFLFELLNGRSDPENCFLSFLQKSLTPLFRGTPDLVRGRRRNPESLESRLRRDWIPGRASLARNDDFPVSKSFAGGSFECILP